MSDKVQLMAIFNADEKKVQISTYQKHY